MKKLLLALSLITLFSYYPLPKRPSTQYGIFYINSPMTDDQKVTNSGVFGVNIARTNISLTGWAGTPDIYTKYIDAGYTVIPCINWSSTHPTYFPTDTTAFKTQLAYVLDSYLSAGYPYPKNITLENEPYNQQYHSGSLLLYCNELRAAITVCNARGIQVSAGMSWQGLNQSLFKYYSDNGMSADSAATRPCVPTPTSVLNGTPYPANMLRADTLLGQYALIKDLKYISIHIYAPFIDTSNVIVSPDDIFKRYDWYLMQKTGKHPVTDETGSDNSTNNNIITWMASKYRDAKFAYAIFITTNNDGPPARQMVDNAGALIDKGIAYRNYIYPYYRKTLP